MAININAHATSKPCQWVWVDISGEVTFSAELISYDNDPHLRRVQLYQPLLFNRMAVPDHVVPAAAAGSIRSSRFLSLILPVFAGGTQSDADG